jgi:hypothetical protein
VVRGGVATVEQLMAGTAEHLAVPGLFGFSVQYQSGRTVAELAVAGGFPNPQISVVIADELLAAGRHYEVRLVKSPGRGYHYTVVTPYPLPRDLAEAFSRIFLQNVIPNPARAHQ